MPFQPSHPQSIHSESDSKLVPNMSQTLLHSPTTIDSFRIEGSGSQHYSSQYSFGHLNTESPHRETHSPAKSTATESPVESAEVSIFNGDDSLKSGATPPPPKSIPEKAKAI